MLSLLLFSAYAEAPLDDATPADAPTSSLAVTWIRDSAEYQALAIQIYRDAGAALKKARRGRRPWGVVLDLDETVLDNSPYQVELSRTGDSYSEDTWHEWCEQSAAEAVPGVVDFIGAVRARGGQVVYVSNRKQVVHDATLANLKDLGLWQPDDQMCLRTDVSDKSVRRQQLRTGEGACSVGEPLRVALYIGDNINDFPRDDEANGLRMDGFGQSYFLLPNPMYGEWTRGPTRPGR